MKLEAVTAELRPRSEWESVDLGLAMVRRDFGRLAGSWWLGMLPVLLIGLPLLWRQPFWFCLVFWWWLPVASRLALFRMSRTLFGDAPGWRDLWRELPRAAGRRFAYRMLWARLSPWRPLTGPVEDLEGLRGAEYRARCRILTRRGDSSVILLAMWRAFLTVWLALTMFATAKLFVPQAATARWDRTIELWFAGDDLLPPAGLSFAIMGCVCLSMALVDLFSTGAGFGIYVNHRTWIEGWDVELAFRRLRNRLTGAAVALCGLLLPLSPPVAEAANGGGADEVIEEVLDHPDFEVHEETHKEPQLDWEWPGGSGGGGGGAGLEGIAVLVKFLAIGGLVALVVWLLWRYRHVFAGRGGARAPKRGVSARVVMGMRVTEESLPQDITAEALAAWRAGRQQEALSLLYRGAIAWMIGRGGVEIAESDTERDCLARVSRAGLPQAGYFRGLTEAWTRLAYGGRAPSDEAVHGLCRAWPFGERRAE